MCGIFGYIGPKTTAAKLTLDGLKRLEYRGYDSWGVAVIPTDSQKKSIGVKKKIGKIGDAHVNDLPAGSMAFGHTRWATHGGVTDINSHPHLDCSGQIAIIHNGIFENYDEVKAKLTKLGHKFISETDTEVAVHLIEEKMKKLDFVEAVRMTFNEMEGLNAIIVMHVGERKFVAARNGSPLVVGFGDGENYLASDPAALLPHTKLVHFLEDEEMVIVDDNNIELLDARTGEKLKLQKQKLEWDAEQAEKGSFDYFMLKEIYEQPLVLENIAKNSLSQAEKAALLIKSSKGSYLVGCGTASYACIAGTYLFSQVANFHINWAIGSEFGYHLNFLNEDSLVIALSQSGETMDILESIKKAKVRKAKIMALVNVLGSSLYRMADSKILVGAGPEKAVGSTKDFTGKLAHLILIAYALAEKTKEGQKVLENAILSVKTVLAPQSIEILKGLAKKMGSAQNVYVIGRGLSYPASLETALKIKEIPYIHAEGLAAGELKHGPLALIEKGTICIAYLPKDETHGANLAGAMEMKARGGYIIGISEEPHEIFDFHISVPDAGVGTIIPNVVVGQLLSYFIALEKGLDPDKPRNLAKSVTVK